MKAQVSRPTVFFLVEPADAEESRLGDLAQSERRKGGACRPPRVVRTWTGANASILRDSGGRSEHKERVPRGKTAVSLTANRSPTCGKMEISGRKLTPLGQGSRTVLLQDVAAVEVAVLIQVIMDRGVNGGKLLQGPTRSKAGPVATRNAAMTSGSLSALPSRTIRR